MVLFLSTYKGKETKLVVEPESTEVRDFRIWGNNF